MRVRLLKPALHDLQHSYCFHERQDPGLGSYFRQCLEEDLVELRVTASIHRRIHDFHRVKSKVFQSIIHYCVAENESLVFAILDGRINPVKRDRILRSI
ncbi:MAG TPA: hypothetical protein DIT64_09585 [Verrucomicrobiales bacterium]|nr:hypothetical protein [Verrucomicrobiales bacterium]